MSQRAGETVISTVLPSWMQNGQTFLGSLNLTNQKWFPAAWKCTGLFFNFGGGLVSSKNCPTRSFPAEFLLFQKKIPTQHAVFCWTIFLMVSKKWLNMALQWRRLNPYFFQISQSSYRKSRAIGCGAVHHVHHQPKQKLNKRSFIWYILTNHSLLVYHQAFLVLSGHLNSS